MSLWFSDERWFGGKGRGGIWLGHEPLTQLGPVTVWAVRVGYPGGGVEEYFVWTDSSGTPVFTEPKAATRALVAAGLIESQTPVTRMPDTSSNTLFRARDRFIKIYRRPHGGAREIAALTATAAVPHTPTLLATLTGPEQVLASATEARLGKSAWDIACHSRDPWSRHAPIQTALDSVHQALAQLGSSTISGTQLAAHLDSSIRAAQAAVPDLAATLEKLRRFAEPLINHEYPGQMIHGDFHLGQILLHHDQVTILDFEGRPGQIQPQHEPRLADTAGLLRSFDYARQKAFASSYSKPSPEPAWTGYRQDQQILLAALYANRAVDELLYETRNRPDWADIPRRAIIEITTKEEPCSISPVA